MATIDNMDEAVFVLAGFLLLVGIAMLVLL